jgi:hypothetical protein
MSNNGGVRLDFGLLRLVLLSRAQRRRRLDEVELDHGEDVKRGEGEPEMRLPWIATLTLTF